MTTKASACTHIAADIMRAVLSDIPEDWPRSMPKTALRAIAKQEDRLKDCANRVTHVGRCLRELDQHCAALVAERDATRKALRDLSDRWESECWRCSPDEQTGIRNCISTLHSALDISK